MENYVAAAKVLRDAGPLLAQLAESLEYAASIGSAVAEGNQAIVKQNENLRAVQAELVVAEAKLSAVKDSTIQTQVDIDSYKEAERAKIDVEHAAYKASLLRPMLDERDAVYDDLSRANSELATLKSERDGVHDAIKSLKSKLQGIKASVASL